MTAQPELFAVERPARLGENGWPMCSVCGACESIGPPNDRRPDLCIRCWSPELDPIGAASWDRIVAEAAGGVL